MACVSQFRLVIVLTLFMAGAGRAQTVPGTLPEAPAPVLSDLRSGPVTAVGQRDLAAEESSARTAVEREPQSADALYGLGEVLMRRNKAAESLGVLTKAAALRRPSGEELRWVGLDYVLLDDIGDAIRWLSEAARMAPADAENWYSLGRAQYTKGTYPAAEASFRRALEIDPRSARAEDNLGLSLAAQNRNEEALAAYGRAIAINGVEKGISEQPLLNRGTLLLHLGQPDKALPDLMKAASIKPGCALCHEAAGEALLALDRLPEARKPMEEAARLEPDNPRFHYELGRLYKRLGENALSAEELKRSQAMYGTHSTPPE